MPLTSPQLTELYRLHASAMVAYLTRRTFDPQVALDLVGETFAVAFERRHRFKGDPATGGRPWLNGIASNLLSDYFRSGGIELRAMNRLGVRAQEMHPDEYERIEELAGIHDQRERAREALNELAPADRHTIELRVVDELSYAEIASALHVSEQTARARVSRALGKLRIALESASTKVVASETQ